MANDSLRAICGKIDSFIRFAEIADRNQPKELEKSTVIEAAKKLDEITSGMMAEANKLGEYGGVIALISEELAKVSEKTKRLAASKELDSAE